MRETTRTILTAVTVATVMALLLPVGAQAAGQLMTIVDADTNARAQVEDGRLRVGDGNGAMTVNGAVAARPAPPAEPFSVVGTGFDTSGRFSLGSGTVAITDLVFTQRNDNDTAIAVSVWLVRDGGNGDCTDPGAFIKWVLRFSYLPADETTSVQLSTPVVATARPVCLMVQWDSDTGQLLSYTITGYRT